MNVSALLKALIPVFVGLFATNMPVVSTYILSLVSSHPALSVVVGSAVAAVTFALQSPYVKDELQKLSAINPNDPPKP